MATQSLVKNTQAVSGKTQAAFFSLNLITQACHGVLNTHIETPEKHYSWFNGLSKSLDQAKLNAQEWIDDLAPELTGGVPLQVIDFGTTFDSVMGLIVKQVESNPSAMGASDPTVVKISLLVKMLNDEVQEAIHKADTTAERLRAWGNKMQRSHNELVSSVSSIQNAETELLGHVQELNAAISGLNAMIAAENRQIAYEAAGLGVSLFVGVIALALAPISLGWSLTVGVPALIGAGASITLWALTQSKINDQMKEITRKQAQLSADQRQIVALHALSMATTQAKEHVKTSLDALSDLRTIWSIFAGELKGVSEKLEKAELSVSAIIQGAFASSASKEWQAATKMAEQLAMADVQVAVGEMKVGGEVANIQAA